MKHFILEYYDWVDKEWKAVPDYPVIPEDIARQEYNALIKKRRYRKNKIRIVKQ